MIVRDLFPIIDGIVDLSLQCDKAVPDFYNDPAYQKFAASARLHHATHYRPVQSFRNYRGVYQG